MIGGQCDNKRFHISIRETFSKSIFVRVIKKNGKGAVIEFSAVFGTR